MTRLNLKVAKQTATLRRRVEDNLREAIRSGHFAPGQRLVERELCEMLDVSRTSVREALRQLEAEGLLTNIPHKGPTVAYVTRAEAEQLYELRALLEGYAGERFAEKGTAEQKQRLSQALSDFIAVATISDSSERIDAKARFYQVLLEGGGNTFVRQTLEGLYNRIALLRMASMARPGRLDHSLAELREIVDAIIAGNGARAREACRLHIQNAAAAALEGLSADEDEAGESQ